MNTQTLSRRNFSKLVGVTAAYAALRPGALKASTIPSSANIVRLSSNENPYGPSEKAKQALQQIIVEGNRYAFDVQEEMKTILAQKEVSLRRM